MLFSFSRFQNYIRSHWAEYNKRYLLFTLAMVSIMLFAAICMLLLDGNNAIDEKVQYICYFFGLFVAGCIFSGTFLSALQDKDRAITYLMLPASTLEKLLCALLFTIPVFIVVYHFTFFSIDYLFVAIVNIINDSNIIAHQDDAIKVISILNPSNTAYSGPSGKVIFNLFLGFIAAQSFFFLGGAYFQRFAFVKTLLSGFIVILFFSMFSTLCFRNAIYNGGFDAVHNYYSTEPIYNSSYYLVSIVEHFFKYAIALLLYITAYWHIKEREI